MANPKLNTPKQLSQAQYDREMAKLAHRMRDIIRASSPEALAALERFAGSLGEYAQFERGRLAPPA